MFLILKNVTYVHSKSIQTLETRFNKTFIIDKSNGKILKIQDDIHPIEESYSDNEIIELGKNQILIPGLIDTHAHAPQFAFTGTGMDVQLLDWLNKYTFPMESKFSDLEFARKVYTKSVRTHLANGTTTICFYGTIHLDATKCLADLIEQIGLRGYVGKVCMDQNSPNFYVESTENSLKDTQSFVDYTKNHQHVTPVITPRFAIACSRELMLGLSEIADKHSLPVQTHLSENKSEIEFVRTLFPECENYTQVYKKYGMLRKGSIMAHCIYLNDSELDEIKNIQAGISHCPVSNTCVHSGIMPLRKYMDKGVKLGLGSDVAGGYSTSILETLKQAIGCSKLYHACIDASVSPVSLAEGFYLATVGGAELLGLEKDIGKFEVGMDLDALIVDYSCINAHVFEDKPFNLDLFEKIIYLMDDRNIQKIFVKGKELKF